MDLAYRLASQHTWAITEPALQALLEFVRVKSSTGFGDVQAAIQQRKQEQSRPWGGGAVGVIPVRGVVRHHGGDDLFSMLFGGSTTDAIAADFRAMLADETVRAIVFDVDSPGGTTAGVSELANEIYRARGKKPIVAIANDLAASAAYWIASAADVVYATPSALVGSIGVYAVHEDISKMAEDMGLKVTFIKAGKYKTEGNEFEPLSDDAAKHLQSIVDEDYGRFVRDVARGRGATEAAVRKGYGEGRILTATQSKAAGLIDGVYTLEQAISRAASMPVGRQPIDDQAVAEAEPIDTLASERNEGLKRLALIRWREIEKRTAV